ncbi:DUF4479 and tRNA-binding domain-containing protein [Listeria aquatica]|uniref:DUF4479 and tRNA-binding domain-containing protein n=1 Tax=Listeria aquatica TaxID=1494960 RepID=A0A841ZN59_9LIST|nr:DUF4479 and tRNA-binding domain-containing protein [Listeria aquatica]MBC1520957.1 DUF4479 and tRNA-binding domain-containing protein [Listeria aquatica]
MIVNVFYNEKGIGDTLIVSIQEIAREQRTHETKGDVVKIFDEETKELSGFNIFRASQYFSLNSNGKVELSEAFVEQLNRVILDAGFDEPLDVDLTPKFVVGYVDELKKHPNADKLSICQVDVGDKERLQIVCGAPNVAQGQKVVVAKVGAVMLSGLLIKPSNLRGVDSFGMLCAARELAIPDAPQEKGILILDDNAEIGSTFPVSF